MGYRQVTAEQLGVVWTHLKAGASNRSIALNLGFDRKTINSYVAGIRRLNLPLDTDYGAALPLLATLLVENGKAKPSLAALEPFGVEIQRLMCGDRSIGVAPMKAKTAWLVINERYGLKKATSYETFKRFVRTRQLGGRETKASIRIETEPGDEVQIDYGQMGSWQVHGSRRIVNAFVGTLGYSRLPFVRFGTSQDQASFSASIVGMLAYYRGAPRRFNLDNLKAGVIKVDLYDPTLNRTFAELCDHYGIMADPARPAAPRDKGKVERAVPVVREVWKRLTALHPTATLEELNELAARWALEEYGRTKHGTTGVPPLTAYEDVERACLLPLPADDFIVSSWSTAKVHSDQFITVAGKLYGLPAPFIGKTVQVKLVGRFVEIYHQHKLVRSFTIPDKGRAYLPADFPEHGEPFKPGAYANSLIMCAGRFGSQSAQYLRAMLATGGNLSLRRAQGCLNVLEKYYGSSGYSHVLAGAMTAGVSMPKRLAQLFEDEARQNVLPFTASERGQAMTRNAEYYAGP